MKTFLTSGIAALLTLSLAAEPALAQTTTTTTQTTQHHKWSRKAKGTAIGAGAGAATGAVVGGGKGALVGAVVGGAAGHLIGKKKDKEKEPVRYQAYKK